MVPVGWRNSQGCLGCPGPGVFSRASGLRWAGHIFQLLSGLPRIKPVCAQELPGLTGVIQEAVVDGLSLGPLSELEGDGARPTVSVSLRKFKRPEPSLGLKPCFWG